MKRFLRARTMVGFGLIGPWILLSGGASMAQLLLPLPATLEDYVQPGTQPETLSFPVIASGACTNCHSGFDTSPYDRWSTSIMAQAGRDPLFHACLAIANQDAEFAGDLCLRCHTPSAWLDGRSVPTDGSALTGVNDFDGITCHLCHRLVDPVYQPGVSPAVDLGILDALTEVPADPHTGQYVIDPEDRRRGPYNLVSFFGFHEWLRSPHHQESELCATCHDVSNPLFVKDGDSYVLDALDAQHPSHDKYEEFPIERTFSEWRESDFGAGPVDMGGRFGGILTSVSSCQDCHMPTTQGYGCNFTGSSIFRDDLGYHDFNGSHTWVLDAILNIDLTFELYDTPSYMAPWLVAEAQERNVSMLERASDLELFQEGVDLRVRVTNQTGHKLPSGYPEGRRMWISVEFRDASGLVLAEHGHYDFDTAVLDTTDTKVYEAKLGLDTDMAATTGLPAAESFHFALNNKYYKDNRIPPRGFTNAGFEAIQAAPVAYSYADGEYWDDTLYPVPVGAQTAEVTVYYQTASKEYIEFLRDNNYTNEAGNILYEQWEALDKGPPVVMDVATIDFLDAPFVRTDCNQDGDLELSDAVFLLSWLFVFGDAPSCLDACDSNDNGAVSIDDVVFQLAALFLGATPPPVPYPACGADGTADALGCLASVCP